MSTNTNSSSNQNEPLILDGTRVDDIRIYDDGITPTLKNRMGTGGNNVPFVAQEPPIKDATDVNGSEIAATLRGFGHGWQGQHNSTNAVVQPAPTLNAFDNGTESRATVVVPTVGFSHTQGLDAQPSEIAWPTLRSEGGGHAVAVAYDEYNDTLGGDIHHSLRAGTRQSTGVVSPMSVRRLTPIECERLMGWPDNHTYTNTNTDTYKYTDTDTDAYTNSDTYT